MFPLVAEAVSKLISILMISKNLSSLDGNFQWEDGYSSLHANMAHDTKAKVQETLKDFPTH